MLPRGSAVNVFSRPNTVRQTNLSKLTCVVVVLVLLLMFVVFVVVWLVFVVLLFCFFVCLFCPCVCVVFFPTELRSCVKNSEAAVPGSPSLIVRTVSVDVKQH